MRSPPHARHAHEHAAEAEPVQARPVSAAQPLSRRALPCAAAAGGSFTGAQPLTRDGLKRVCFQMKFNTDDLPQYLTDHEHVW